MNYTFRPIKPPDHQAIADIFNHYVKEGFAAFFEDPVPVQLVGMLEKMAAGYPSVAVADESDTCVGFAILHHFRPQPVFLRTAEVTYFIHPQHTRKGLGGEMLDRLIEEAAGQGIRTILACIAAPNEASIAFHRKHGFSECGRFPGVGVKGGETFDLVWMARKIQEPGE